VAEAVGFALECVGNLSDGAEVVAKFAEAENAAMDFFAALGGMVNSRLAMMPWDREYARSGGEERANVRKDDARPPWEKSGCVVVEDLNVLTELKMNCDNKRGDAAVAAAKYTLAMSAWVLGLGKFGEGIVGKGAAEGAEKGWKTIKEVYDGYQMITGEDRVGVLLKDLEKWWHDSTAYYANNNDILHHFIGITTGYQAESELKIQYLMRCKVLYILKRLINECGSPVKQVKSVFTENNFIRTGAEWVGAQGNFDEYVQRYRIKEYIRDYCMSERFWVRKDHACLDWVHLFLKELDEKHRNAILRTEDPGDEKNWFEVNFKRYWPIHFVITDDVIAFCRKFSTDWTGIAQDDVEDVFLQRGEARWEAIPGSPLTSLVVSRWVDFGNWEVVDSETPVRAVMVFRQSKGKNLNGIPVRFTVERTDGLNVPGPSYNAVSAPISEEDGKSLGIAGGRTAAVCDFTYSYRWKKSETQCEEAKVYHGLKPMLGSISWEDLGPTLGYKAYKRVSDAMGDAVRVPLGFPLMSMGVRYSLGDGIVKGWAVKRSRKKFYYPSTEILLACERRTGPMDAVFNERNRAKFRDTEFLQRQCAEAPPPETKKPVIEKVLLLVKKKGQDWAEVDPDAGFSTLDQVKILFIVEEWSDAPIVVQLLRVDGLNIDGPFYTTNRVVRLDNKFGGAMASKLKMKYGYVIEPTYYKLVWDNDEETGYFVDPSDGEFRSITDGGSTEGHVWCGIKPVCRQPGGELSHQTTEQHWTGYQFSFNYGLGTNRPGEANISWGESLLRLRPFGGSVPLAVDESWTAPVAYGLSAKQEETIGITRCRLSTMPAVVLIASKSGAAQSAFLKFLDSNSGMIDIAAHSRSA
jgi:hypothetical protein